MDEIPLSRPDVTEAEVQEVVSVLRGDRLSIGPKTLAFEAAVAKRADRKHGVSVNSGTSGLHLCVKALGLGEGDEVITTPFSFVATTNCLLFERVKPVFVDIDPDSYNMDPALLERAITPRTRAMLPVEVFGNTRHFGQYEKIARKHGLKMIEDCCEALGGKCDGRPTGSFGDCGVFAFYPNKQITTGEGGMIVTNDDNVADLCRSMRNQGRDTSAWLSHARLGYNYRLSDINCALGAAQVGRLDDILAKRRSAAELYNAALGDIAEIHLPPMDERKTASWFVYVIRLSDKFSQAHRDGLMAHLRSQGVGCNPYFVPIHLQPYVAKLLGTKQGDFPITERLAARTIALPFFANLKDSDVQRVKQAIQSGLKKI